MFKDVYVSVYVTCRVCVSVSVCAYMYTRVYVCVCRCVSYWVHTDQWGMQDVGPHLLPCLDVGPSVPVVRPDCSL